MKSALNIRRAKVEPASERNQPIDRDIEAVAQLERSAYETRSRVDHIAGAITRRAGTATAVVLHGIWFIVWIVANLGIGGGRPFDPYPFSMLTTIVSLEAIFLTLFVLISQNRMSHEADKRAAVDLEVNVLAEREATMTLRILHEIATHVGVKGPVSKDLAQLLKETKLEELSQKLEKALPPED